jgi:hypothetical protein
VTAAAPDRAGVVDVPGGPSVGASLALLLVVCGLIRLPGGD